MGNDDVGRRGLEPVRTVEGGPADAPRQDMARLLGGTVRTLRRRRGWSQQELAERSRISYQFVSEVETGKRNFSIRTLAKLCEALGTPVPALILAAYGIGDVAKAA